MVIIQLAGGLGNQMFQYALYLQLKSLGKDIKIDDVSGFAEDRQRVLALAPFGAGYERATREEMRKMLDSSPSLQARIRRKLCGRKKKAYFEADKRYKPEIMEWDDIYLEGYWQTEKYFQMVEEQVREVFDVDRLLRWIEGRMTDGRIMRSAGADNIYSEQKSMRCWLERIGTTEAVSVHIRRGDYLLPENQELFGEICTEEYYHTAMDRMRREHPGCVFYLFTNDKQWAGKWADDKDSVNVVDIQDVSDSGMDRDYAEFVLMSKCKHHILANSSFSWWASYLNSSPGKSVLAPDRWLNGWDCEDIYRADMKKISAAGTPE